MTPQPPLILDGAPLPGPQDTRVTVVHEESAHPIVDTTGEDWLMTVPHLLVREIVAFALLIAAYAALSYAFDAPLLDIADPSTTPNPSKAPWYFLGLQELLHYYPPFISGVIIPGLAVAALVVVPYFHVNIVRKPFLTDRHHLAHLATMWAVVAAVCATFYLSSNAGPVWPLIGTTLAIAVTMTLPLLIGRRRGLGLWIASRSLPTWIFTWFLLSWVALTVIGTFFRGPGWSFTLPWEVGIYD